MPRTRRFCFCYHVYVQRMPLLVIAVCILFAGARGQCVREDVLTNSFRGEVFALLEGNRKEQLSGAEITLKQGRKTRLTFKSDENGRFSHLTLRPGKYILDVNLMGLSRISLTLVLQPKKIGASSDWLLIRLQPPSVGLDSCDGAITVQHK